MACALTTMLFSAAVPLPAQTAPQLQSLSFRTIGPANMSGRIVDLAVNERDPYVFYAATATGGVWKTVDNGVTWRPVFEKQATHSVGAIALHPVDTSVIWVGTGERANRQSNSWGDGVYRSVDGGRSWRHMGLRDSKHIGRIALHPSAAQTVYVAAMGHLWGPNEMRGLYKSTDGGQTWRRTLYVDTLTGVVDVAIDPSDPAVMYAATYQRMRKPFGFDGGGPGSGLWKSADGGETWRRLGPTRQDAVAAVGARVRGGQPADTIGAAGANGLPIGEWGRTGISIHRNDPRIVYASIEQGYRYNASTQYTQRLAGLYRSEDRGETWTHMSDWNPRPMYASQPLVDPSDDQRVYMMNEFSWSDDGGRTFTAPNQSLHGDDRIIWVNPRDRRHIIKGDDGGIGISWDRGRTWLYVSSLPVSQWYRVALDDAVPFNVYGGLQDNGSWMGPSATWRNEGVLNEDWRRLGGGDGFLALPDTVDDRTIYAESQYLGLTRIDRRTWQVRDIRPGDPVGHIAARRNWDSWGAGRRDPELGNAMAPANWDGPYIISPHDHRTLYAGTHELWVSRDQGESWTSLGDLTTGMNRRELRIMNRRGHDHTPSLDDGIPYWPTITAIAESPVVRGHLWAGTDDGVLKLSRDAGRTWTDVTRRLPGLPRGAWVSGIEPSRSRAGTAYVVWNNYRSDDYANYLYRTTDAGATWESITSDLPAERVLRTVREDPRKPEVLWLGAELGLFVSVDGGRHWVELRANLPTVAVNDLQVHGRDNDLVLGTHGRGIWILDNVNAIQELTAGVMAREGHLFTLEPAWQIRRSSEKAHTGDMVFEGANPPDGAIIDYWLRDAMRDSTAVSIHVISSEGHRIVALSPQFGVGINRVVWDLRAERLPARPGSAAGARGPAAPLVAPGRYTVRLSVRGQIIDRPLDVRLDPRSTATPDVIARWVTQAQQTVALYREVVELLATLEPLNRRLPLRRESTGAPPGTPGSRRPPPAQPVLAGQDEQAVRVIVDQANELFARTTGLLSAVSEPASVFTADQQSTFDYIRRMYSELAARAGETVRRLTPGR